MKDYNDFKILPLNLTCNSVLLVGAAGKTGLWYIQLLLQQGKLVFAYDKKYNGENSNTLYSLELLNNSNLFLVNEEAYNDFSILNKVDAVTFSPGVSLQLDIFKKAIEQKKNVFSELEFCLPFLTQYTLIGVTGTDGKSTTVSLIEHLLNDFQNNTLACGNLGIPLSEVILKYNQSNIHTLVIELSSYQLELSRNLKLQTAIFLNIAPDHLDRYKTLQDYENSKWHIINNMTLKNYLIAETNLANKKDSNVIQIISVNIDLLESKNFSWKEMNNIFTLFFKDMPLLSSSELLVAGKHNLSNILFALESCFSIISIPELNIIKKSLMSFKPLRHRFELVYKNDKVTFINDSKATTTQAVNKALENVPIHSYLFLGGKGKGEDYSTLKPLIIQKSIKLVFFGEERQRLYDTLHKSSDVVGVYDTIDQALTSAWKHYNQYITTEVTFLFAPGCTSWDQYNNFEERGDHFKSLVTTLFSK